MKSDKTVTINGQRYDSTTGLPLGKSTPPPKSPNTIKSVQSMAQRSKEIYNRASKKAISDIKMPIRKIGRNMDIARSKSVAHFAPRPTPVPTKITTVKKLMDIGPTKHPIAAKIAAIRSVSKNIPTKSDINKSNKDLKEEVIAEALSKASIKSKKPKNFFKRNARYINIFSISIVLLVLVGYFTYLNMPSISVRIASAQAGIEATFPEYQPGGYSIDGPVTYTNSEVTINFHANTGNSKFVIKQSRSSWDSSAVKLMVDKKSNNETSETKESGLTIYTYENNAAWVNGGILYEITGDAPLSGEQIRHIATSL